MSEVDDFLAETLARQLRAEEAIHNGHPTLRLDMWSTSNPVTLLGAFGVAASGWEEVSETFRWVASRFSNCEAYGFELLAARVSGDVAYTVGYEHSQAVVEGQLHTYTLRATQIYRRESGAWKVVHRHGDPPPGPG